MNLAQTAGFRQRVSILISPPFVSDILHVYSGLRPENNVRPYTFDTTLLNRTLDDDSATIDAAGLRNNVNMQRGPKARRVYLGSTVSCVLGL